MLWCYPSCNLPQWLFCPSRYKGYQTQPEIDSALQAGDMSDGSWLVYELKDDTKVCQSEALPWWFSHLLATERFRGYPPFKRERAHPPFFAPRFNLLQPRGTLMLCVAFKGATWHMPLQCSIYLQGAGATPTLMYSIGNSKHFASVEELIGHFSVGCMAEWCCSWAREICRNMVVTGTRLMRSLASVCRRTSTQSKCRAHCGHRPWRCAHQRSFNLSNAAWLV